jgi:hypothetical protein
MGAHGYAGAPEIDGAIASIAELVQRRFGDRVWLVSRCDEPRERVLMAWLTERGFFRATGVPRDHVRFCRQRDEKAIICRELGITHFVDDRLEVLGHLIGVVPHLYLLESRAGDAERFGQFLPRVRRVTGWSQIASDLLRPPATAS